MIQQLYIRDFAVVDEIDLRFGPGMNLLTGETGSGKSIIVDAIGVALGERADSDVIRSGRDRSLVEIVMDISDSPIALQLLHDAGLEPEDGCIIVSREIQRNGKSICRINGRVSTVSLLKSITDHLVDTHGQHEHQSLLKAEHHMDVLDMSCGHEIESLKTRVAGEYAELSRLKEELQQLKADERDRARSIDLYQFQIEEISGANLAQGEDEELLADRVRLANAEKLHSAASTAFELVFDGVQDRSAQDVLSDAVMALSSVAGVDSALEPIVESLQAALYQVEDASRELRAYRDSVEFNPERLEAVEERLDLIRVLKKKYGESISEIIEYGRSLQVKLDSLVNSDERLAELSVEIERATSKVMAHAEELSAIRQKAAQDFGQAIERELCDLSMANAIFQVACRMRELHSSGIDDIEFMISANPGEPVKPLAKIASGGEMSRVMLAIKSVMAAVDDMPTLIFDEIDVGVGGRTAEVIGKKLHSLAVKSQILCITHLPQIACLSGEHFYIEKKLHDGRTIVCVRQLDVNERVTELARMLSGSNPSGTAIQHAREMLGFADIV